MHAISSLSCGKRSHAGDSANQPKMNSGTPTAAHYCECQKSPGVACARRPHSDTTSHRAERSKAFLTLASSRRLQARNLMDLFRAAALCPIPSLVGGPTSREPSKKSTRYFSVFHASHAPHSWTILKNPPWQPAIRMLALVIVVLTITFLPSAEASPQPLQQQSASSLRAITVNSRQWWASSARQGSVRGGSVLTFAGTRFDLSTSYVVRFTGTDDEAETDPSISVESPSFFAMSFTQLVITVPSWPAHETNVTMSLLDGSSLLEPAPGNSTIFEYLAEATVMQSSTAPLWFPPSDYAASYFSHALSGTCSTLGSVHCSSPTSGGSFITVSGAGFQQRRCPENEFCVDVQYNLKFHSTVDATKSG